MSLLVLLLLQGLVAEIHGSSLCGWRRQPKGGNVLRYYGGSTDNVTVVSTAEALIVLSPFPSSGNYSLQELPGLYTFCVRWIPALRILNITYGLTKSLEFIPSDVGNNNAMLHPLPDSCSPNYTLINLTTNGQLLGNHCRIAMPIQAQSHDVKVLEQEILQVSSYLDKREFTGRGHTLRRWIHTVLSNVEFNGRSHHFGKGALQAAVYKLDSIDVLDSINKSMGVSLHFPTQVLEKVKDKPQKRLHVVRILGQDLFQDTQSSPILGDQVIGINLENTTVSNLLEDIVLTFHHEPIQGNVTPVCVFWDEFSEEEKWSTRGCRTVPGVRHTECRCNHLTYFALLMQISSEVISEDHLVSLSAMTFAGCIISALSCLFTICWMCCSRKIQSNPTIQIHANLLAAVFLLDVTFILSAILGALDDDATCMGSAIALHFALLCTFTWMAIEGFNLYRLVVKVFQSSSVTTLKLALFGWGGPVLTVLVIIAIDWNNYGVYYISVDRPSSPNSNATLCWLTEPTVHQVVNLGFFAAVLAFNICMLVAMTRRVLRLSSHTQKDKVRHCVTLLGLSLMLGLPWGLAFFSFGPLYLPIQYLFSILNALQGLFIFLWYWALSQPHAKDLSRSSDSTSATPASPRPDQSLISDHKKLLT